MGKNSKKKGSGKSTHYEFHAVFNEVNSGVNKLVVGATRSAEIVGGKPRPVNVTAKAIDVPFSKAANDDPFLARIDAIDQLLNKTRSGDKIEIFTADPIALKLGDINDYDVPSEARSRFNAIAEKFKHISISAPPPVEQSAPVDSYSLNGKFNPAEDLSAPSEEPDPMGAADRLARIKINTLLTPNRG